MSESNVDRRLEELFDKKKDFRYDLGRHVEVLEDYRGILGDTYLMYEATRSIEAIKNWNKRVNSLIVGVLDLLRSTVDKHFQEVSKTDGDFDRLRKMLDTIDETEQKLTQNQKIFHAKEFLTAIDELTAKLKI